MSSPFTFPSPFPNSLIFPSPTPQFAPSPLAGFLQPSNSAPSPAAPFPTLLAPTPLGGAGGSVSGYGGQAPISKAQATGAPSEIGIESVLNGIEEVLVLLGRLEDTLMRMKKEQEAIFGVEINLAVRSQGEKVDEGNPVRIMSLQQEYSQILLSLQPILTSSLIGALPVPLSSAIPPPIAPLTDPTALPTISDLTIWAEQRAELDFSRREGVRAGAKAVLDVFKSKS